MLCEHKDRLQATIPLVCAPQPTLSVLMLVENMHSPGCVFLLHWSGHQPHRGHWAALLLTAPFHTKANPSRPGLPSMGRAYPWHQTILHPRWKHLRQWEGFGYPLSYQPIPSFLVSLGSCGCGCSVHCISLCFVPIITDLAGLSGLWVDSIKNMPNLEYVNIWIITFVISL